MLLARFIWLALPRWEQQPNRVSKLRCVTLTAPKKTVRILKWLLLPALLLMAGGAIWWSMRPTGPTAPTKSLAKNNLPTRPVPQPVVAPPGEVQRPGDPLGSGAPQNGPVVEVPPALAALAYGRAWNGDQPPAQAQFRDWVNRYLAAANAGERERLVSEGVALARARRLALRTLIEKDPEQALALTLPAAVRVQLPAAISGELEERFSATADYSVMVFDYAPAELVRRKQAGLSTDLYQRFVTLDGREIRAYTYGRREGETTKFGIPVHGVRLDDVVALHMAAIRVLEPGEVVDPARTITNLGLAAAAGATSGGVRAEIGGKLVRFSTPEELLRTEADYERAESKLGRDRFPRWAIRCNPSRPRPPTTRAQPHRCPRLPGPSGRKTCS